jgi:pyridoxine 5'-phosphate synthase PdxJ
LRTSLVAITCASLRPYGDDPPKTVSIIAWGGDHIHRSACKALTDLRAASSSISRLTPKAYDFNLTGEQNERRRKLAEVFGRVRRRGLLGLGVNAGHDLGRHNLIVFRNLPHLDEVSIGHAIWAEALFHGIDYVVSDYLALLAADPR